VALYENPEVLAVDQDSLGVQSSVVTNAGGHWVLAKPLANGNLAVVLFNAGDTAWTDAGASFDALSLDSAQAYTARDLWAHTNSTATDALHVASIPAHGSVILRVSSAAQQLNDQLALVGDALGGSLHDQLQAAIDALAAGRTGDTCGDLGAYVNHVQAQAGKHLPADRAAQLIADAEQIEGLLGC
jgi:hypothetical protein